LRERRDARLDVRIVFVEPHEHPDAPHAVALLRARRERPRRRAAEPSDEFASSKANAHLALLCLGKKEHGQAWESFTLGACCPGRGVVVVNAAKAAA
jgi:hypothetical protein